MTERGRFARLSIAVLAVSMAVAAAASVASGPSFAEMARLKAVERGAELIQDVAERGVAALDGSSARSTYETIAEFGTVPLLVSSWLSLAAGEANLDPLTLARSGWLLLTAMAPLLLFWLVEPVEGARVALFGAVALLASPRWLHALGTASADAMVAALWLAVLAPYVRSLPVSESDRPRRRAAWAALGACALGFGLAVTLATLWVVPILLVHASFVYRRPLRRALRHGRLPVPALFVWALLTCPLALLLAQPMVWGGPARAAKWLTSPVGAETTPALYRAELISTPPWPPLFGVDYLIATIPLVTLALAVVGSGVLLRRRARPPFGRTARPMCCGRRPFGRTARPRRMWLGLLVALGVMVAVLGPVLTPPALTRFPPRIDAALPFVAILAGIGLERVGHGVVDARWRGWVVTGIGAWLAFDAARELPTAAASFNPLVGGTPHVVQSNAYDARDGSELAPLARAIDSLGQERVRLDAPDVAGGYFKTLRRLRRLETDVDVRAGQGEYRIVRGTADGAIATSSHGGAVLWSLVPAR